MAKRLQIILRDSEFYEIQCVARAHQMSVVEWARHVLKHAGRSERASEHDIGKKLEAVRAAVRHSFPSGDIQSMLAEIRSAHDSRSN